MAHSGLEVASQEASMTQYFQLPQVVATTPPSYAVAPYPNANSLGGHTADKEAVEPDTFPSTGYHTDKEAVRPNFWQRHFSRKWIWGGVLGVIVVAAVVGGVVGGTHHNKTAHTSGPASVTTSSPSSAATPTVPAKMSGTATTMASYTYPTAVSWGAPHLEVFAKSNKDHTNYWKYRGLNGTDSIWHPTADTTDGFNLIGGGDADFQPSIAAISRQPGNADLFVTGNTTNNAWHAFHDRTGIYNASDGTTKWDGPDIWGFDKHFGTGPAMVTWGQNRLDIFLLGQADNALNHISWDVGTASLESLGGKWAPFIPSAVSWGLNRLDVFVVDPTTNALWHRYYDNNQWQPAPGFENLGGYLTSRPTSVSYASGHIDVFARGGDAGLWHLSFNGTWSNWTSISGNTSIQAEPEAVSWGPNRIDVFAWAEDQSLVHKSFDGTRTGQQWLPENFDVLGGGLGGPPKAVSDGDQSLHVFCYSRFGVLQHAWFNQTAGWGPSQTTFEQLGTPGGS